MNKNKNLNNQESQMETEILEELDQALTIPAMKSGKEIIQAAMDQISKNSNISPKFECETCSDSGLIFYKKEIDGRFYSAKKNCHCLDKRNLAKKLAIIPRIYRG